MTWVVRNCDPRWIGLDNFDDGPSPLEDNDMEFHINHKRFCIRYFLVLERSIATMQVSI
jgi:hypothetical protein